jgi:hypothetical protein
VTDRAGTLEVREPGWRRFAVARSPIPKADSYSAEVDNFRHFVFPLIADNVTQQQANRN